MAQPKPMQRRPPPVLKPKPPPVLRPRPPIVLTPKPRTLRTLAELQAAFEQMKQDQAGHPGGK